MMMMMMMYLSETSSSTVSTRKPRLLDKSQGAIGRVRIVTIHTIHIWKQTHRVDGRESREEDLVNVFIYLQIAIRPPHAGIHHDFPKVQSSVSFGIEEHVLTR
jgi:hypothetical protein